MTSASQNGAQPGTSSGVTQADGSVTYNFPAVDKTMQVPSCLGFVDMMSFSGSLHVRVLLQTTKVSVPTARLPFVDWTLMIDLVCAPYSSSAVHA